MVGAWTKTVCGAVLVVAAGCIEGPIAAKDASDHTWEARNVGRVASLTHTHGHESEHSSGGRGLAGQVDLFLARPVVSCVIASRKAVDCTWDVGWHATGNASTLESDFRVRLAGPYEQRLGCAIASNKPCTLQGNYSANVTLSQPVETRSGAAHDELVVHFEAFANRTAQVGLLVDQAGRQCSIDETFIVPRDSQGFPAAAGPTHQLPLVGFPTHCP